MSRYTGPRKKKLRKFEMISKAAPTRPRKISDYGIRLREKQKLRFIYGVSERQFRRYLDKARQNPKSTEAILLQLLETRLDNIVYRLGLAKTRNHARQLVNHGHVQVDGKKVDIPSYTAKTGQVITLKSQSLKSALVVEALKEVQPSNLPTWLSRKGPIGKVDHLPREDELRSDIDVRLIVEYYSR